MLRKLTMIALVLSLAVVFWLDPDHMPHAQDVSQTTQAVAKDVPIPGDSPDQDQIRLINNPGVYGLGSDLPGSRYAIVGGHLVRIDPDTMEVQSILRAETYAED